LNKSILYKEVQAYISSHLHTDVHQLAMAKSPFEHLSSRELAVQISSKKKAEKKLPTWFTAAQIYYPEPLSIEQTSSETTATYKASLIDGGTLIDLTGGFGVDSYYFSKKAEKVVHCEINTELSEITAHNLKTLGADHIQCIAGDGLAYLETYSGHFNTIYIDPARRSQSGKVFMLKDCTPNVIENMDLLLSKSDQVIIKTSPLLDITAGIKELQFVTEVHIVSTRNECKELLFILKRHQDTPIKIICSAINESIKQFSTELYQEAEVVFTEGQLKEYIYEPDAALLKSGAFSLIGKTYGLEKLQEQTQLYTSDQFKKEFPGRIFKITEILTAADLKKEKELRGNIIVRNYPDKAENLSKKYKIKPADDQFLIFTKSKSAGLLIIKAQILQYY